jgi:hypothetical protein
MFKAKLKSEKEPQAHHDHDFVIRISEAAVLQVISNVSDHLHSM